MRAAIVALVPFTFAAALMAQDAPDLTPAKQLAKLEVMLGTFEGKGTVVPEPGMPPMPWTARSTVKKILDGHFMHESLTIDFGDAMPTEMQMQIVYGWDRENENYFAYNVNNMGMAELRDIHWSGKTAIITSNTVEQGQPALQREVIEYGKDGFSVTIQGAIGKAPLEDVVTGTFTRVNVQPASATNAKGVAFMMTPPAAPMKEFNRCAGRWSVKGTMAEPGGPSIPISGIETMTSIFGGHALMSEVLGDPVPPSGMVYKMLGFTIWNVNEDRYEQFSADNMGAIISQNGWQDGDKIVFASAALQVGKPTANRMILHLDDAGKITEVSHDAIHGTGKPQRVFAGTYQPAKAK